MNSCEVDISLSLITEIQIDDLCPKTWKEQETPAKANSHTAFTAEATQNSATKRSFLSLFLCLLDSFPRSLSSPVHRFCESNVRGFEFVGAADYCLFE
jgi:hypothetical protein